MTAAKRGKRLPRMSSSTTATVQDALPISFDDTMSLANSIVAQAEKLLQPGQSNTIEAAVVQAPALYLRAYRLYNHAAHLEPASHYPPYRAARTQLVLNTLFDPEDAQQRAKALDLAIKHLRAALKLKQDWGIAMYDLAQALVTRAETRSDMLDNGMISSIDAVMNAIRSFRRGHLFLSNKQNLSEPCN